MTGGDGLAPTKVLLAMSGGVDSSVAAVRLKQAGHEVVGVFMRLGSPGESLDELIPGADACPTGRVRIGKQGCCSVRDAADARLVAARLDIPFYVVNFKREFGRIINYFVDEYNAGRTPNPCVRCNDWLKFGRLHEHARGIGATHVASGHYARIGRSDHGKPQLLRGHDAAKDQSYVLFGAPREKLDGMLLPIGGFPKSEVRAMAAEHDLPVFDKPDSQEICFVPDDDYAGLVARRSPGQVEPGAIVDTDGKTLGEHPGHQHFTIGQRRRIGVALGHPLYVVEKDASSNTITVGAKEALLVSACQAGETNWLVDPPHDWTECTVQFRAHGDPAPAEVRSVRVSAAAIGQVAADDDTTKTLSTEPTALVDAIDVRFASPQEGVAPGQAIVAYDGDVVLGGGWIHATQRVD
ncbi:MAG: tRNA 2-thiouridine(34) synthase MnmA [Phycisphaerales bacterium]